jgi:hypothetical protein
MGDCAFTTNRELMIHHAKGQTKAQEKVGVRPCGWREPKGRRGGGCG